MSSRAIKAKIWLATLPIPSQGSSLACKHIFLHSLRCFLLIESPIQIPAAGDAKKTAAVELDCFLQESQEFKNGASRSEEDEEDGGERRGDA